MGEPLKLEQDGQEMTKHRGMLIAGLIIAMLFGALEGTIVGTAMPRIVGELGGLGYMTWLTTAYMLTSTAVVPIAGKLADLLGRRVIYVTGLVIFMASSALCGTTDSMTQLIVYRGIQGIGGGIMMPMAMIIIGDLFTGKERAKWQGVFGGLYGLASVIGPQIGGWIVDGLNWRWVFYINLPVGIIAVIFIAMGLNKHKTQGPVKFDVAGMFTMIVGVVSLLLGLSFGGSEYPWLSWQIIGLFVLAVIAITAFIIIESRTEEAILPVRLFKNRTFTVLNGIGFLMSIGMFGAIIFVPLFMQGVVGVSASASGTIMTPMMITMIIASIIGGQIVYKIGPKVQISIGMIVMAAGFLLLTTMSIDTTKLTATLIMFVIGLGMGLVMPILTLVLQESFPKSELGVVTSSSQFFRSIGGTFGMTILGAIMNHKSTSQLTDTLVPVLQKLPEQAKELAAKFTEMIHTNPQGLYTFLFSPEAMKEMPAEFLKIIAPILKNSLVSSLHSVYLFALIFIVLGAVLTVAVPKIKLTERKKAEPAGTSEPAAE
ncbi:MDR family MFS transporter [Paenibacillus chitinolyticus]|uniref:MDR family MFS transporter n=1 Tax=Paenibacillus chitinolyticus TaxID=79263 RepID=UPI0036282B1A